MVQIINALMKIFNKHIIFLLSIFITHVLWCQEEKDAIYLISRPLPDSILLRWAPTNYQVWNIGNKYGYTVVKYTLFKEGNMVEKPQPKILTNTPIKPIPLEQWEPLAESSDYAAIIAEAIYSESFLVESQEDRSEVFRVFNIATEQENRHSFAMFAADHSPVAAKAAGLYFVDKDVKKGEKYLYRVYLCNQEIVQADTGYVYTGVDEYRELPAPKILMAVPGDKTFTLAWEKEGNDKLFTSYIIQRSDDGGKTFNQLNKNPLVSMNNLSDDLKYNFYIDTLPDNKNNYLFRIAGNTPFGEVSPWSDTISVLGKSKITEVPVIINRNEVNGTVELEWQLENVSYEDLTGFKVMRSTKSREGFKHISDMLPPHQTIFTDHQPLPTAYYVIQAIDVNDNSTFSQPALFQLVDTIPPSAPTQLRAKADTNGIVTLQWKQNSEEDIYGYRIYRANARHEELSQITVTPVRDTVYFDTIDLKTLSSKVYYRVMAIDQRQNYSEFSNLLEVKRPDIVPPVSPVIKKIESTDKGIYLEWINSTSNDVKSNIIFRKEKNSLQWNKLKTFDSINDTVFIDSIAEINILYSYKICAQDSSGLISDTKQELSAKRIYKSEIKTLEVDVKIDREKNSIMLSWKPDDGIYKVTIYRGIGDEGFQMYKNIANTITSYLDTALRPNTTYYYLVKAIYKNNGNAISNKIQVNF